MRFLARHRVKAISALVAAALVACIALFVHSYQKSGSDSSAGGKGTPTFSDTAPSTSATPSATKTKAKPKASANASITGYTFPNGLRYTGDNFYWQFQPQHVVTLRVTSPVRLIRVGYLAPESYDAPYGDMRNLASPWELTLHSAGNKYHAALFIGTDASGIPVTCQIFVDGKLVNQKTTLGQFSRQVCVG